MNDLEVAVKAWRQTPGTIQLRLLKRAIRKNPGQSIRLSSQERIRFLVQMRGKA